MNSLRVSYNRTFMDTPKNFYPFFSIITVCYNSEITIADTIDSVLNQSYNDIEYIIIDALSTDKTMRLFNPMNISFRRRELPINGSVKKIKGFTMP